MCIRDRYSAVNFLTATKNAKTATAVEDGADFVAYNSITKDWCKAKVLADLGQTEAEVKADLDAAIAEQKAPTILSGTPAGW